MLRKTICILMILMLCSSFVLIEDSLARSVPTIRAVNWDETNVRILPDYGTNGDVDNSQSPAGSKESSIGGDRESGPLPQEFERAIKEWSDFLYLRIKGINRR